MTNEKFEKIKKFYEVVKRLQSPANKEIGLLVIKNESLVDVLEPAPNSNLVATLELNDNINADIAIDSIYKVLKAGKTLLIRLHEYLDPKIYNQLYLISKDKRMQFAKIEDWVNLDVPDESMIIIVSTDKELEKLNYENFFSLVGPVERL